MSQSNISKESLSQSYEDSNSSHNIDVVEIEEDGVVDFVLSKTSIPLLTTVSHSKVDPKVQGQGGSRPIPSAINRPPVTMPPASPLAFRSSQRTFVDKLQSYVQNGVLFWKKVFSDSYRWQIFKSLLLCAVGYKLTKEYNKYTTKKSPEIVNDKDAWLARCKKYNEKKRAFEKPQQIENLSTPALNINVL